MTRRLPGLLYLLVILTGIVTLGIVPGRLFASADPAAVIAAVQADSGWLRVGIAAGIVCYVAFLLLPVSLYPWLRSYGPTLAAAMVAFVVASVPLALANLGHRLEILDLALGTAPFDAWTMAQREAAVAAAERRYDHGIRVVAVFWGLWLLPLGVLGLRSRALPRVLCALLLLGGVGYVVSALGAVLSPTFDASPISAWIIRPASVGEIGTCAWLLWRPPVAPPDRGTQITPV